MSKEEEKSSTKIYTLVAQVIFQKAQSYKNVPYYFLKSDSVNNFFRLSQISVFNSAPILNIVINLHVIKPLLRFLSYGIESD